MVFCNQMVANYFPENETIAFRYRLIISQKTGTFQAYGALQSKGGLLFPRVREFFKHMVFCSQKVAYYFPENETIAIRWWPIISNIWCFAVRRWLIISQTTRPLQSEVGLLFPIERDHCNQIVANYFPENETIAFKW